MHDLDETEFTTFIYDHPKGLHLEAYDPLVTKKKLITDITDIVDNGFTISSTSTNHVQDGLIKVQINLVLIVDKR
ncbi:hypothetical protein CR513_48253, partial [Mucuna pruriens]